MTTPFLGLKRPRLKWDASGAPHNLEHDDGYFSDMDGLAETRAVFLHGCGLPEAFADHDCFVVGELGFGTGLNFLSTWELWRRQRRPGTRLHFISIENAPMNEGALARAHQPFNDLAPLAKQLRAAWPPAIKGVHRRIFDADGVVLTLYFMDVELALAQMEASVHAWFLDGFAPARNGAMWSDDVFSHLARLSAPNAKAASFSVAGFVRRGLASAGFTVRKAPGFGRKRERLEAVYSGAPRPALRRETRPASPGLPTAKSVIIIGGGIAGASLAYAFLRRGLAVTVIDADGPATHASGNAAALVAPRLDREDAPPPRFHRTAFAHAVQLYRTLGAGVFTQSGLLWLAQTPKEWEKFLALHAAGALPPDDLCLAKKEQMAFLEKDASGALFLPKAGQVRPKAAITALMDGAQKQRQKCTHLTQEDGQWRAHGQNGEVLCAAPLMVLAGGAAPVPTLAGLDDPHFRLLRGQVSLYQSAPPYKGPAILQRGYVLPLPDGQVLTGATHDPVAGLAGEEDVRAGDHDYNLATLRGFAPGLARRLDPLSVQGRAGVRAATPDQQPYAGPLVDGRIYARLFADLKDGRTDLPGGDAALLPGLFILGGLGSRGFTLAPLLGEAIAAQALGEPAPLERGTAEALHPARRPERLLKKEL